MKIDIPHSGLVLQPRTVIVALAVGVVVTLLSAVLPAARATRVPPMAALQEGSQLPPSRFAKATPYFAGAAALIGALFIVGGMFGPGGTTTRLGTIALGAVLVFLAVAMVSRYVVRPIAAVLGWPLQKLAPVSGRLARDNTVRNPGRTAATASALMIGLGVVVFVAVFAQGLKSSFVDSFDKVVRADYIVQGKNFMPLPSDTAQRVANAPGADVVAGIDMQQVQVDKKVASVIGIEPYSFARIWRFDWQQGGTDGLLPVEPPDPRKRVRLDADHRGDLLVDLHLLHVDAGDDVGAGGIGDALRRVGGQRHEGLALHDVVGAHDLVEAVDERALEALRKDCDEHHHPEADHKR